MSLWKWNEVELEIDMDDADFLEKYEKAFKGLEAKEKQLQAVGSQVSIVREYCGLFYQLFDDIFGKGTGEKLFSGKQNARICEECYQSFIDVCGREAAAANKRRSVMMNKYRPNRAQRRASGKK